MFDAADHYSSISSVKRFFSFMPAQPESANGFGGASLAADYFPRSSGATRNSSTGYLFAFYGSNLDLIGMVHQSFRDIFDQYLHETPSA